MSKPVNRILVSNDDGIDAPGLQTTIKIAEQLSDEVWVLAPMEAHSGAGHSLRLSKPLRMEERGPRHFAIGGTPTDCVMIATRYLMKDYLPDLILSGVNWGQNIAEDIRLLVQEHLGINQYHLMAHDWGGPVAFVLASKNAKRVKKLVMLDTAVPGDGSGTFSQNGRRWHHAFHQTKGLPEALVTGREEIYLGWFYDNYGYQKNAITQEDRLEYLRTYKKPDTLRSGFAYYRALDEDVRYNEELLRLNGKLIMPVLALGGGSAFGRGIETFESLQRVSENVSGGVIQDCGHWIQEEKPQEVLEYVMPFLESESTKI